MSRYIDAEWEEKYWTQCLYNPTPDVTENDIKHAGAIIDALKMAKTADVVEVVRCKDCFKKESCRTFNVWAVPPSEDWFCADGERREDDKIH